ncbi:septum site-determining protein MinC [Rhizobium herbae]|uniref:Probable septum site-determining protein MinC n=1 Tax=Rhizobium herbae TaxID=508661 RepID=A0ABS7HAV7_9HYPH|nr:septum site-determining protein MinC [Rhizobium herbae]MBW9064392.1 septum site-determining protein MinC [Rhizobium herbae]
MNDVLTQPRPIRLKGRSFLALALSPEMPVDDWLVQLDNLAARSAGFFLRKPIVLDLTNLDIGQDELRDLVAKLATRKVRIMGIEGAKASLLAPDLPPALTDGKGTSDVEIPAVDESSAPAAANLEPTVSAPSRSNSSVVVSQPVRSGQSLHHAEGDVTIVGSVASGSEVVAGGSIHIYGALRGRAMAGTMGNSTARIFCRKLEAELIAIDGFYLTAEDLEPSLRGKAVQIWLEGETIKVAAVI